MNSLSMPLTACDHIQRPRDATVELVEYGDYECPHCKAACPLVKLIQAEFDTLGDALTTDLSAFARPEIVYP